MSVLCVRNDSEELKYWSTSSYPLFLKKIAKSQGIPKFSGIADSNGPNHCVSVLGSELKNEKI